MQKEIQHRLNSSSAVALLGPRQCGKSTLATWLVSEYPNALLLDMERPADRALIEEPEAFFDANSEKLICLDEIQRVPELFPVLRYIIDKRGTNGQFLVLGSASRDLIEQSSETLAGRIQYLELTPFLWNEVESEGYSLNDLWLKGGFPRSFLSPDLQISMEWRQEFIRSFLERDLLQLKPRLSSERARKLWTMVAHCHGQLLNKSQLAVALDVDVHTVGNYLDILEAAFMIRRLPPYHANLRKRLVKSPKIYVRDSGILHALLSIDSLNQLFSHPIKGYSWESFVMDQLLARLTPFAQAYFFRTARGDEVDLVIEHAGQKIIIEIKASAAPKLESGFWNAKNDLQATAAYVVAQVPRTTPIKEGVIVLELRELLKQGQESGWLK